MRSPVPDRVRRIAGRVSWTVVDQVLSALSNFGLSILVARSVDAEAFGVFSTAFLVFTIVLQVARATIGQPLQISFAAAGPRQFRAALRSALGASVLLGVVTGAGAALVGLLIGGQYGLAYLALGVCMPGLLAQDICRMAFFSGGHPRRAAAIDALWAALLFPALLVAQALGVASIAWAIVFWGLGALAAALVGLRLLQAEPRVPGAVRWTWQQRGLTGYLVAEYVLGQGLAQLGILGVAITGDQAGVGALRAAQVLLGPLGILGTAAFLFTVPEVARRPDMSARGRARLCLAVSGVMGLAATVYSAIVLLLPDAVGRALLGDTWSGAQSVLLPMCLLSIAAALATGPAAVLYGMGRAKATFSINAAKAPLLVLLMGIGVPLAGGLGAAWAIALTEIVLLPFWALRVRRVLREQDLPATTDGPAPPPVVERPFDDGQEPVVVVRPDDDATQTPATTRSRTTRRKTTP